MNNAMMFSKASDEWSTPQDLFDALSCEWTFALDVAATAENTKCANYFTREDNALTLNWLAYIVRHQLSSVVCWMNPPYSRVREFINKAKSEAAHGCIVVCLVPARTDTRWWHDYVWNRTTNAPYDGVEIRFIKGRLKFGGVAQGAPFPSVVIIFRPSAGAA